MYGWLWSGGLALFMSLEFSYRTPKHNCYLGGICVISCKWNKKNNLKVSTLCDTVIGSDLYLKAWVIFLPSKPQCCLYLDAKVGSLCNWAASCCESLTDSESLRLQAGERDTSSPCGLVWFRCFGRSCPWTKSCTTSTPITHCSTLKVYYCKISFTFKAGINICS